MAWFKKSPPSPPQVKYDNGVYEGETYRNNEGELIPEGRGKFTWKDGASATGYWESEYADKKGGW